MVNPLFSIGGIASGLDTAGIIDQLMNIERVPITRYQRSQSDLRTIDSAWSKLVGQISAFRSALDDVRRVGSISEATTATSDNESAVAVTSTGDGSVGSLSFTVESLATRHRVSLSGTFGSASGLVDAGTLTIQDETGGTLGTITTDGTTSLQDLADEIDALGVGVNAQVVKVNETQYQLLLSADETGASGGFSVSTDIANLGTATEVSAGADAHLSIGGLDIYRSSNTIDDLVEGASIRLLATTTSDVTVDVSRDSEAVVEKVQALVDAANTVLSELKKATAYDSETGKAGVLQGDSLARELAFDIREAFTQVVGSGDINYANDVGISLSRDGAIEFDDAKLREAFAADPDGVAAYFSESLTGTSGASLTFVGDDAVDGAFTMSVSQAASVAMATGATFTPPAGSPKTFTITAPDGTNVSVTIDEGMTAAQAVGRISAALDAAGIEGMRAELVDDGSGGDALQLSTVGYGSGATFSVSGYGADLDGSYAGTDVVADFGNGSVTGSGRSITGDGAAAGLVLSVTGGVGSYDLSFGSGLGGVLDRYLESLEGVDGRIQQQRDSITGRISDFDDQIEAFEQRLTIREASLRAKFTALESAMGRMQSQGQWLAGALGGLPSTSAG